MPTTAVRMSIVLQRVSGLPEDRSVMTLWFEAIGTFNAASLAAVGRDFLITNHSGDAVALQTYLSNQVATTGHTVNLYTYDMATGLREAYENAPPEYTLTFGTTVGGSPAPSEVALVGSFRNNSRLMGVELAGPIAAARRRGRIFFGPLAASTILATGAAGDARPSTNLRTCLLGNLDFLRTGATVSAAGARWSIYSRPFAGRPEVVRPGRTTLPALPPHPGQLSTVEQTWVDDAFDTQRRRGAKRTTRVFLP